MIICSSSVQDEVRHKVYLERDHTWAKVRMTSGARNSLLRRHSPNGTHGRTVPWGQSIQLLYPSIASAWLIYRLGSVHYCGGCSKHHSNKYASTCFHLTIQFVVLIRKNSNKTSSLIFLKQNHLSLNHCEYY